MTRSVVSGAACVLLAACASPEEPFGTTTIRGQLRTAAGAPAIQVPVQLGVVPGASCGGAPAYQVRPSTVGGGVFVGEIAGFRERELQACVTVRAEATGGTITAGFPATLRAGETLDLGVLTLR
ncbi:hypothetical protein [Roseisolibacter sp. H3M3-2]|uniref:hypothetical protein n=1 Tax=Roseisolibacter sp. H3M3-2 TaxID=3031323 RepID=UPI0023DCE4E5|nr:hypothetical protein [Roseisolibacter sp. H3M3-2]MDF1505187.1 hypothetical protein [Roseisolibacter sp. H3M3-2]